MIKLAYTKKMKAQDNLWKNGEDLEDLAKMQKLQRRIIKEARKNGFTGVVVFIDGTGESVVEVYETLRDYDNKEIYRVEQFEADVNYEENHVFGCCGPLIGYLEEILNRKNLNI